MVQQLAPLFIPVHVQGMGAKHFGEVTAHRFNGFCDSFLLRSFEQAFFQLQCYRYYSIRINEKGSR